MTLRVLSYVFFLMGLVLLGAAAAAYFVYGDFPGATIDEATREFPNMAVGENEVRFRLHNPTRHTVKVVGCSFC